MNNKLSQESIDSLCEKYDVWPADLTSIIATSEGDLDKIIKTLEWYSKNNMNKPPRKTK